MVEQTELLSDDNIDAKRRLMAGAVPMLNQGDVDTAEMRDRFLLDSWIY